MLVKRQGAFPPLPLFNSRLLLFMVPPKSEACSPHTLEICLSALQMPQGLGTVVHPFSPGQVANVPLSSRGSYPSLSPLHPWESADQMKK